MTGQERLERERSAWIALAGAEGIGPATMAAAVDRAGGAAPLLELALRGDGGTALRAVLSRPAGERRGQGRGADGLREPASVAERLRAAARARDGLAAELERNGITAVTLLDPTYPARLRAIETPPPVLFVRGAVIATGAPSAVAVVGTRHPTESGRRTAARLAGALARSGAVIVSGLAIGVDGAAHAAAIAEAAPTVAVLGGGHGRLFPRAHARLVDAIVAEGGAVVSEWGPTTTPARWSFPRRNRLVSGLSDATVVVEAGARSGALITATWALEQGRGCYVVPGAIDAPMSRGCLALLRELPDVVRVVAGPEELVEDLGLGGGAHPCGRETARRCDGGDQRPLGATEDRVAEALLDGAFTVDELVGRTGEGVAVVLGALTLLEVRGLVVESYGRYRPAGRLATGTALERRGADGTGSRPSG